MSSSLKTVHVSPAACCRNGVTVSSLYGAGRRTKSARVPGNEFTRQWISPRFLFSLAVDRDTNSNRSFSFIRSSAITITSSTARSPRGPSSRERTTTTCSIARQRYGCLLKTCCYFFGNWRFLRPGSLGTATGCEAARKTRPARLARRRGRRAKQMGKVAQRPRPSVATGRCLCRPLRHVQPQRSPVDAHVVPGMFLNSFLTGQC